MARVTVWNEYRHEQHDDDVAELYPDGIHAVIADVLEERGHEVRIATLDDPEHGLTEDVLDDTDVLTWTAHAAHDELDDQVAERVVENVWDGMGFIPLHASRGSKPFKRLMGTTCSTKWRHGGTERLWVIEPGHPIANGLDEYVEIPESEMYGEPAGFPQPDELVFVSWYEGGEVFRSGCCWTRGRGRIFAFGPGHEWYPIYHQEEVQQIIGNAVDWAVPGEGSSATYGHYEAIEPVEGDH